MQPGGPRLQPRSVTDLIDATFGLYRRNFALFAGVVAVLMIPETLVNMLIVGTVGTISTTTRSSVQNAGDFFSTAAPLYTASGIQSLLSVVFSVLILGALSLTISRRFLNSPITVVGAYQDVGIHQFLVLAGTLFLGALAAIVYLIAAIIIGAVLYITSFPIGVIYTVVIAAVTIALSIYVGVRLVFIAPAVVIERRGVIDSYRRSWFLSAGYWWRILGLVLLVGLIVGILGGITGAFATVLTLGHPVLATGLSGALSMLVQPIQYTAYTLLYYDQRIRKEGFDLEYAAQQARIETGPWYPSSSS